MSKVAAWAVLVLGFAHIVFGIARFQVPILQAVSEGFVGRWMMPEIRRTAFWFIICGPMFMLAGHAAIRAVDTGDSYLLRLIGTYMLIASLVGVAAFPRSPLWAPLLLSLPLIAAGLGWLD